MVPPQGRDGWAVVAYARQFLGNPYVYGGNSLTDGIDCSGFTQQIYAALGVSLGGSGNPSLPGSGGRPGCLLWTCGYLQWKRRPDTCVVAVGGDHRVSELHVSSDTLREESSLILGGQTEGLRFVAQALFARYARRSSGHAFPRILHSASSSSTMEEYFDCCGKWQE